MAFVPATFLKSIDITCTYALRARKGDKYIKFDASNNNVLIPVSDSQGGAVNSYPLFCPTEDCGFDATLLMV